MSACCHVRLFVTLWTKAWWDLPDPRIERMSFTYAAALEGGFFTTSTTWDAQLRKKVLRKLLLSSHPTRLAKTAPFWSSQRTESLCLWRCPVPSYTAVVAYSYSVLNFPPKCHWLDLPFQAFILTMGQNHHDHHGSKSWWPPCHQHLASITLDNTCPLPAPISGHWEPHSHPLDWPSSRQSKWGLRGMSNKQKRSSRDWASKSGPRFWREMVSSATFCEPSSCLSVRHQVKGG